MKKVFIAVTLFISLHSTAQKPWEKFKTDSVTFTTMYGTVMQYQYQENVSNKSSHKMLYLFAGAQYMYLYNFALYLGYAGYEVSWDEKETSVIIKATPKISNSKNPPAINVVGKLNKDLQITTVTINGPADDLIKLYVRYWNLTPITINQLKAKKQVEKEFVSDLVAIKWTGTNPVITITKNEKATMDLFPLK